MEHQHLLEEKRACLSEKQHHEKSAAVWLRDKPILVEEHGGPISEFIQGDTMEHTEWRHFF